MSNRDSYSAEYRISELEARVEELERIVDKLMLIAGVLR